MKILFILFLVGLTMIFMGYWKSNLNCGPEKIIYRYVPMSFKRSQEKGQDVNNIFRTMFNNETQPWFNSYILPINVQRNSRRIKGFGGNSSEGVV